MGGKVQLLYTPISLVLAEVVTKQNIQYDTKVGLD